MGEGIKLMGDGYGFIVFKKTHENDMGGSDVCYVMFLKDVPIVGWWRV